MLKGQPIEKHSETVFALEFKGQEQLAVPQKMARLCQWCEDVNRVQQAPAYAFDVVVQKSFEKDQPTSFKALVMGFKE